MKPEDNQANIKNKNRSTDGTNKQYDQAMGNKGKLKNPNQIRKVISDDHQMEFDAVADDFPWAE